jgi:two-component system, OmpR family, sensor histidine kinase BaeS
MQVRLKTKLSLAFLLVSLIMVAMISLLANYFLTNQFKAYAISKQTQKISGIAALLASRYADWGYRWDSGGIETIGVNSLGEGLLLRLKDLDGQVLWDARQHNNGMCTMILASIAQTMTDQNNQFQGGYVEETVPVVLNQIRIGSVDVGYYGPYFYTPADIQFLRTLNQLLLAAALLAMLASIGLGLILARQLTRPMDRVIEATRNIAQGQYVKRIREKSNTKEIAELTRSVNSLAETLGKQEKMRRQLTADVAHELRTPLAILQSHLEAMIDGTWPADQNRLESCHGEVVRLAGLVGGLEKLTLLEQENLLLHRESFDLADLLQKIVTNFQNDFSRKSVGLILETGPLPITADADKLSQVLINLLANALQFTNAGGEVRVMGAAADHVVQITVADSGIGIGPDDLPHIFERFYRTDKSRSRHTGGSGIGLTIARAIVEAHDGTLTVQSVPDQGSRFIVTLPG